MDKITKTINIDNSRSHRNGLLPFVRFGSNSNGIEYVNWDDENGNYGQYVCDFALYDVKEDSSLENETRLRYLDVLSKYNFIQEQLRNAVFVKKYTFSNNEVVGKYCSYEVDINEIRFRTEFNELYERRRYSYKPLDINDFVKGDDYYFAENSDLTNIEGEEYFVLIPNYKKVLEYNEDWIEWWGGNESEVFTGYDIDINNLIDLNELNENFIFAWAFETYCLGAFEVFGVKGETIPKFVYCTNYYEMKNKWTKEVNEPFYKFLTGLTVESKWIKLLDGTKNFTDKNNVERKFKFLPPTVDINAIINSEVDFETLFIPYEYSIIDGVKEPFIFEYKPSEDGMVGSALTPTFSAITAKVESKLDNLISPKVESKLDNLISPKAIQICDDIFGVFEEFIEEDEKGEKYSVRKMFECTFREETSIKREYYSGYSTTLPKTSYKVEEEIPKSSADQVVIHKIINGEKTITPNKGENDENLWIVSSTTTYQWWDCKKLDGIGKMTCADGEDVKPNDKDRYRNATIVSCIKNMVADCSSGHTYYIFARYNNGRTNPKGEKIDILNGGEIVSMKIPYVSGETMNVYTIDNKEVYDVVESIVSGGDFVTINYIMGATKDVKESGIHYEDVYLYKANNVRTVPIDGVYLTELYYDTILKKESMVDVYSKEYKLNRKVLQSTIKNMEVGSLWTPTTAVNTMLITKDGSEGLQEDPKYNINLTYNRGNAAAWEKHFKLSECNTMEDLINYGNNFFNL